MQAVGLLSNYISQGVYTVAGPFHPFGGAVDIIVVQQEDGTFKCTPWYVKFGKFQGVLKRREKIVAVSVNGREADFHMYLDHKGEAFFWREVEPEEDETIFSPPSAPSSSDEAALPGHGERRTIFKEDSSNGGTDDGSSRERPVGDSGDEMALSELPHPPPEAARVCQNTPEGLVSGSEGSPGSAEKQQQAESNNNPDCGSPRPSLTDDAKSGVKNGKTPAKSPKSIFSLVFRNKSRKFSESQGSSVAVRDGKEGQGETGDFHRRTSLERAERVADLLEKKWATGDFDAGEGGVGFVSAEVSCRSGSSGLEAATGRSEQHETGANSDGIVCSSLLSSDEQVISAVDPVSGEVKEGNPEVVCNRLEGSTIECLGGAVVELGHSVQETVSGRWYSETETGTFMVEESSGNCNESREQISKNDVAGLAGYPVPLESVSDLVEFAERSTTIVVKNLNGSCSTVSTHVCSSDMHSRSSNIDETRLDLFADPDSVREPSDRIRAMQQLIEVPVESFTEGSDDCESKVLEHGGEKRDEERGIHVFAGQESDECAFCDCNASMTNRIAAQKSLPEETFNQTNEEERPGEVDFHDQLVESKVNNVPKGYFQMEFYASISEGAPGPEGSQKEIGRHVDEMHRQGFALQSMNDSREPGEYYIQEKKTHVNELSRSGCGEEFKLSFNSDYALKSCLALSDPNPPSDKGKSEDIVSLSGDEVGNICRLNETDKTNEEFASSFRHPDESKAPQTGNVHVAECNLPHLDGSSSKLLRSQTSPINITKLRMKGRVDESVQLSGSLPNMGLHTENPGADRVLSRSLDSDSACLKRGLSHDIPFSNSENMESNAFEKGTIQGWTATEASVESWSTAETAIGSMQPENSIEISLCGHLLSEGMGIDAAAHAFESARVSMEEFHSSAAAILKNEKLIVRIGGQYFPWDAAAPIILGMVAFGLECPVKPEGAISVERVDKTLGKFPSDSLVPSGGGWRLWPFTFRRLKTTERCSSARPASKDDAIVDRDASLQGPFDGTLVVKNGYHRRPGKRKVRSNTPTSEQLLSLNLKEGQNIITFTFSTRVLGKQQVDARIYLWKWNTRIVISDVDGTITKSDVLGQFMPLVGKDWTQSGVAHLFSAIKDNGYQLLFLSARAIAQAYLTRQFLVNIKQDGKVLPDGPVVMSPDGLFPSLYREVIRRAPHEFKIACLEDIRALFPPDCNPFYAGFGNRDTDEISYLKVGIPKGKIFIINPKVLLLSKCEIDLGSCAWMDIEALTVFHASWYWEEQGEVAVNHRVDMKSYTSLHKLVNGMFPAMSSSEQEDFNSWNYWKVPLPDIDG